MVLSKYPAGDGGSGFPLLAERGDQYQKTAVWVLEEPEGEK